MPHRDRRRLLVTLAALLAAGVAEAVGGVEVARPGGAGVLRIDAPAPGERLRQSEPRVLVRGSVGAELLDSDVVIALDESNSTLLASGLDVDGDGVVGVTRGFAEYPRRIAKPFAWWTTDPDDATARAELVAGHALIDGLSLRGNRIGLLTYTSLPRVRAEIGSPDAARRALEAVRIEMDPTGTNVEQVLKRTADLLGPLQEAEAPRPRALLLFSDGAPTLPAPRHAAKRRALREAARLADAGVSLYVLALGVEMQEPRRSEALEFLRDLAAAGRGPLVQVDAPAHLLEDLPPARPLPSVLEIENLGTGERAGALHVGAEGRFEAWLPLVPGANELEVRASWPDGRRAALRRAVDFEAPRDPSDAARPGAGAQ